MCVSCDYPSVGGSSFVVFVASADNFGNAAKQHWTRRTRFSENNSKRAEVDLLIVAVVNALCYALRRRAAKFRARPHQCMLLLLV